MKLTIVGGGGFRVPIVYGALLARARATLPFDEIVLHDVDAGRLERIGACSRAAAEHGDARAVPTTTDLEDGDRGRRLRLQRDPRRRAARAASSTSRCRWRSSVLGQETTGPGGICFALRTIPAIMEIAQTIAERAPRRLADQLHQPRRDGHGGGPAGARRPRGRHLRLARRGCAGASPKALGEDPARSCGSTTSASTTSAGCRPCATAGGDRLPELLADDEELASFEEGRLFGADWLRTLGMIPNEYLYYFYYGADTVEVDPRQPQPRGAYLLEQQAAFYAATARRPGKRWRAGARRATSASAATWPRPAAPRASAASTRRERRPRRLRGRGDGARRRDRQQRPHGDDLNTANRSALPFLDEHAVVEVPALVGRPARPGGRRRRSRPRPGADRRRSRRWSARRSRPR